MPCLGSRTFVALWVLTLGACGEADQGANAADAPVGLDAGDAGDAGDAAALPDADGTDPDSNRVLITPTCPTAKATCVETAPAPSTEVACPGLRWVGKLNDANGVCPDPAAVPAGGGTWQVEQLFGANAPPALRGYCAYTWTASPANPNSEGPADNSLLLGFDKRINVAGAAPGGGLPFQSITKDCHVAGAAGTAVTQATGPVLESAYYRMVSQVAPLPNGAGLASPAAIRVAVADSSPHGYVDGVAGVGTFKHGLNVGRIIRKIGCPGDGGGVNCIAQVSDHLALPQITPAHASPANGGFFGYQSEVAAAIFTAVSDWQGFNTTAAAAGTPLQDRLVVNLSLGWDPMYGGDFGNNADALPPHIRAVYAALQHANCRGAIAVAAAGNDPGGPTPRTGAMYPAAWEAKAAPTLVQCQTIEGLPFADTVDHPIFPPVGVTPYRPVIYAAAGVGQNDYPLSNGRAGSRGRLVATADSAATRYQLADGTWVYTESMTGSSAAAAAVSGAAAAVWGYRPAMRPYEVMRALYDGGVNLDPDPTGAARRAEVCISGTVCNATPLHRLSVCGALTRVCSPATERCFDAAHAPVCATPTAYGPLGPDLTSLAPTFAAAAPQTYNGANLNSLLPGLTVCGHAAGNVFARATFRTLAYPADTCPLRQYPTEGLMPWAGPQPTSPVCPECNLKVPKAVGSKGTLYVFISSDYATSTVTNGIVETLSASGSVLQGFYLKDLGLPLTMPANTAYSVSTMAITTTPTSARITFTVTDKYGTSARTDSLKLY